MKEAANTRDPRAVELDAAIVALPQLDLDAMSARALELAALRRLHQRTRAGSVFARFEAPALIVLAVLQLIWSLKMVLAHVG